MSQTAVRSRRFFVGISLAIASIAGFARSHYLRTYHVPTQLQGLLHLRVHSVTGCGGLAILASQPLRLVLSGAGAWLGFAAWLTG